MQYILTKEEYEELRSEKLKRTKYQLKALQELCIKAANHVPIDKSGKIWHCDLIYNKDIKEFRYKDQLCNYCDECPCIKVCPFDHKELSQ